MSVHRFPVNPQSTLEQRDLRLWDVPEHLRVRLPDPRIARWRAEDRSVRRGLALGIVLGLLAWPAAILFCWLVVLLAGVVTP